MGLLQHLEIDVETGCWNWTGRLRAGARPRVMWNGRLVMAARLSAMLWRGFDINSPLLICHTCDNGRCFNPKHLFAGTPLDNIRDCKAKGRMYSQKRIACARGHVLPSPTGVSRVCQPCVELDKQYQRNYQKRYRETHKTYFSEYGQKWRESHPNYWKDYANAGVAQ